MRIARRLCTDIAPVKAVAVAMVIASLLAGCADPPTSDASSAKGLERPSDPGFGHVHGLGINPADATVYAATHFGVWRLPSARGKGNERPQRIAQRWQDTMGFTIAGPDLFYGSGHPDAREDLPPHL